MSKDRISISRIGLGRIPRRDLGKMIPVVGSFIFFPDEEKNCYVGAEIDHYSCQISNGDSASESEIGFHVLGGYAFGNKLFAEAKHSTADLEAVEAGGRTILLGYRI